MCRPFQNTNNGNLVLRYCPDVDTDVIQKSILEKLIKTVIQIDSISRDMIPISRKVRRLSLTYGVCGCRPTTQTWTLNSLYASFRSQASESIIRAARAPPEPVKYDFVS
jgi:hypothetical protein